MSEQPTDSTYQTGGVLDKISDVRHYTGGDSCQYQCSEPAEFVVVGKSGTTVFTFAGCRSCLNRSAIYPIDNGWVDERSAGEEVRNA